MTTKWMRQADKKVLKNVFEKIEFYFVQIWLVLKHIDYNSLCLGLGKVTLISLGLGKSAPGPKYSSCEI